MKNISVLMSVYADERPEYLERSLQSITADQTLKPDEIVLIADGPLTPQLDSVIEQFAAQVGDDLILVRNATNLGLTKSLNRGLGHASGRYIARMDSDDIALPHRFELQLRYMDEHPDIDVVGGSLQEFNSQSDCLMIRNFPPAPEQTRRYICKAAPLAHPAAMIRRTVFDRGLRYDERYRTSQDIALWFDIICSGGKIANLTEPVLMFRRDGEVFMRRSRRKAKNEFKIYLKGIYRLRGPLSFKYIYPLARLGFRMLPVRAVKAIYNGKLRRKILNLHE